jgi:pyrroloquinoline quinone (PQQ) biosynthesis protein C
MRRLVAVGERNKAVRAGRQFGAQVLYTLLSALLTVMACHRPPRAVAIREH